MLQRISVLMLLILSTLVVVGQRLTMNSLSDKIPFSVNNNPAFLPSSKKILGVPLLSNHSAYVGNNGFSVAEFTTVDAENSVSPDLSLIDNLWRRNKLEFSLESNLFYFSRINGLGDYLDISYSIRSEGRLNYSDNLLYLGGNGNVGISDPNVDLRRISTKIMVFHQFSIGYNRLISPAVRFGMRFKVLNGVGLANLARPKGELEAGQDRWAFDVERLRFYSSGFSVSSRDGFDWRNKFFSKTNWGTAADIGLSGNLNDKTKLSMSLIDLGFIRWRDNTYKYELNNIQYEWTGFRSRELDDDDSQQQFEDDLDSLGDIGQNSDTAHISFIRPLTAKTYLTLERTLRPGKSVGVTFYSSIYNWRINPAFGFFYKTTIGKKVDWSASLNVQNRGVTLGSALNTQIGKTNIYVASDNVASIMTPASQKTMEVSIGAYISLERDPFKQKKLKPTKLKKGFMSKNPIYLGRSPFQRRRTNPKKKTNEEEKGRRKDERDLDKNKGPRERTFLTKEEKARKKEEQAVGEAKRGDAEDGNITLTKNEQALKNKNGTNRVAENLKIDEKTVVNKLNESDPSGDGNAEEVVRNRGKGFEDDADGDGVVDRRVEDNSADRLRDPSKDSSKDSPYVKPEPARSVPPLPFSDNHFIEEREVVYGDHPQEMHEGGYITFGVFPTQANAEHFQKQMLESGYRTKVGYLMDSKYYYVYKYKFEYSDRSEAIKEIKAWHKHPDFPNAWLLIVKKKE